MESLWYYLDGELERGPIPLDELVRVLKGMPDPRSVYVWTEGMEDWADAGYIPEVRSRLPLPPLSIPLPAAPHPVISPAPEPPAPYVTLDEVEKVTKLYRRLVLLVGAKFSLWGLFFILGLLPSEAGVLAGGTWPLMTIVFGAMLWTTYNLATRLGSKVPGLWMALLFLPFGNLAALGLLSGRATAWCRHYGLEVGLLGPSRESLQELRERVTAAPEFVPTRPFQEPGTEVPVPRTPVSQMEDRGA